MTYPTFTNGQVLPASDLNAIGLWLVKSQAISAGVSSVTVTSAFSTDYTNYRIIVTGIGCSVGAQSIKFQLNNSTGSTYSIGGVYGTFGSTAVTGYGPAAATSWTDLLALDTVTQGASIDLFTPFTTTRTTVLANSVRSGATANGWYFMTGMDTNAVSNTGFTIAPVGAGTFTGGTISVYGYRN